MSTTRGRPGERRHDALLSVLVATLPAAALLFATAALASPWQFVGARYQAMGGTGVGFANDSAATYWNQANLGFDKGWDVQLPVTLNGSIENDALEKLSGLVVSFDNLEQNIKDLFSCAPGQTCIINPTNAVGQQRVADFLTRFALYGKQGESAHLGIDIGLMGRYNNFGFSILSQTLGTVSPNTDLGKLGLVIDAANLVSNPSLTPSALGSQLAAQMVAVSGLDGVDPWSQAQADHMVALVEQSGGNPADPNLQKLLTGIAASTGTVNPNAPNLVLNNSTGALTAGLSLQEFAFTYAHVLRVPGYRRLNPTARSILRLFHKRFSIGITPKYMLGITFLKFFGYDDGKTADEIVKSIGDFSNTNIDHNFGLDIAVAWRPMAWLKIGVTARNVNSPEFDFEIDPTVLQLLQFPKYYALTGASFELPAQVRVGIALTPIRNLVIAFDIDATENEVLSLPDFSSRIVSLGAEYTIPMGRHFALALRLGGYNNIAPEVQQDWAMTGGFGLRIGGFVLDASAGGSFEDERIRTGNYTFTTLPTRLDVGLTLKWEHSF